MALSSRGLGDWPEGRVAQQYRQGRAPPTPHPGGSVVSSCSRFNVDAYKSTLSFYKLLARSLAPG